MGDGNEMVVGDIVDRIVVGGYVEGEGFMDVGRGGGVGGIGVCMVGGEGDLSVLDRVGKGVGLVGEVEDEVKVENIEGVERRVEEFG